MSSAGGNDRTRGARAGTPVRIALVFRCCILAGRLRLAATSRQQTVGDAVGRRRRRWRARRAGARRRSAADATVGSPIAPERASGPRASLTRRALDATLRTLRSGSMPTPVRPLPRALRSRRRRRDRRRTRREAPRRRARRAGATTPTSSSSTAPAAGFVFDEGILKSASRGVSMGLGVRVQKGDATGYAYVEELDWDAMKRAAETAAQIATGGGGERPGRRAARRAARAATSSTGVTLDVPGLDKRALLERASRGGARLRPARSSRSRRASPRRSARSSSSRATARWRTTSSRSSASASASSPSRTASGRRARAAAAGARRIGYFEGKSPEWHAREAARQAIAHARRAARRPPAQMEVVLAPGDSGILLHEAVGHGLEADFNRKGTSNYAGQDRQAGRERALHGGRRRDAAPVARHHQRRRRGQRAAARACSSRRASSSATCTTASAPSTTSSRPSGNGRRESFALRPDAADDQHHPRSPGPHDPEEILKSVKRGVYAKQLRRRPGRHLQRRLRLLADRELPRRGRQAHRAAQGREPHRQRPRRAAQGDDARQRRRGQRRHLDLRQGRAERAGRRRVPDDQDRGDHGRRDEDRLSGEP